MLLLIFVVCTLKFRKYSRASCLVEEVQNSVCLIKGVLKIGTFSFLCI